MILDKKRQEIKRLEKLSQSPPPKRYRKQRSRSGSKSSGKTPRSVLSTSSHERWTNTRARQSKQWDSENGMLISEK